MGNLFQTLWDYIWGLSEPQWESELLRISPSPDCTPRHSIPSPPPQSKCFYFPPILVSPRCRSLEEPTATRAGSSSGWSQQSSGSCLGSAGGQSSAALCIPSGTTLAGIPSDSYPFVPSVSSARSGRGGQPPVCAGP